MEFYFSDTHTSRAASIHALDSPLSAVLAAGEPASGSAGSVALGSNRKFASVPLHVFSLSVLDHIQNEQPLLDARLLSHSSSYPGPRCTTPGSLQWLHALLGAYARQTPGEQCSAGHAVVAANLGFQLRFASHAIWGIQPHESDRPLQSFLSQLLPAARLCSTNAPARVARIEAWADIGDRGHVKLTLTAKGPVSDPFTLIALSASADSAFLLAHTRAALLRSAARLLRDAQTNWSARDQERNSKWAGPCACLVGSVRSDST